MIVVVVVFLCMPFFVQPDRPTEEDKWLRLTFRFRAVMDVDLLGSGLPARQRRGPIPAQGLIAETRH